MLRSIRFKLSVVIFLLVALITTASSVIVMNIMDRFILEELIKKGASMARSAATAAAYNMLSDDKLALDTLAASLREIEDSVLFVAAVDNSGKVVAHSTIGRVGRPLPEAEGEVIRTLQDGATVRRAVRASVLNYEFRMPVAFSGKKIGDIYLALDAHALKVAQQGARIKILLVSAAVLLLGVVGIFYLSSAFTSPIKKLTEGVLRLSAGSYDEDIQVSSRDEMGDLTGKFNTMAKTITQQKQELRQQATELEEAYVATVRLLATAIDTRDSYTLGHSTRVGRLSILLGEKMGLGEEALKDLEICCMFHDVGKIRTPDYILNKESPLTPDEFVLMMRHTVDGAEILKVVDSLHKHIPATLYHHEWYNGNGYPEGLKGNEIPLQAAIISITDAYDAMTSSRPYRRAMSREEAERELLRCRGTQFAPHIVDAFVEILKTYEGGPVKTFLGTART